MKKAVVALVLALVLAVAGCGKSGTKPLEKAGAPPANPASTESALAAPMATSTEAALAAPGSTHQSSAGSPGEPTPAELGAKSLEGANPAPVADARITDGGTLVWRFHAEPDTLNPLTGQDAYTASILGLVTDSLAARNLDTLEFEPRLAEKWELSEDHLTYTFHLRKDVKWQDGAPFTSADVVYSYQTMMNPKVNSPHLRNYFIDLEGVTAPDDYTVVFKWKKPYFLSFSTSAEIPVLAKHIFDTGEEFNLHPAGRRPMGNGMFKFVRWTTNEEVVLERNEDYYGRKPHIKRIIIRFIPDDNSAILQASSGGVDFLALRPETWVKELQKDVFRENFNRYYYYEPNYSYIGWNERRPYFADKRVRCAMAELVDRDGILKEILYGLAKKVTGTFYINSEDYSPEIMPLPYDPEDAKKLLDEAGWIDHDGDGIRDKAVDGQPVKFSFNFMYPSSSVTAQRIGVLLQEQLRAVGIVMNLQNREWATFTGSLNEGSFDAVTLGWSLGVEQDPYQLWHSSQVSQGSNYISFKNAELDKIIEEARTEFDPAKRHALYHRFNGIVHDEQPYTFLFCTPALEILNKRFHNVIVHKLGLDIRDWHVPADQQ
jgi:peptide/nickel transport system substrate-binding protein